MTNPCHVLVRLWPLVVSDARLATLHAGLSPDEKSRAAGLRVPSVARSFVIARGILRELLSLDAGCRPEDIVFVAGPHGKPGIAAPAAAKAQVFNLSHSAGMCALATTRVLPARPEPLLGVDIEEIRPVERDLARAQFSTREADWLDGQPANERDRAFIRCWVLKEAYLKATGAGLQGGLAALELDAGPADEPLSVHGSTSDARLWRLASFDVTGAIAGGVAVRTNGASLQLEVRNLDAERLASAQNS
jgi:4'-phosphopantetheinyl transferase